MQYSQFFQRILLSIFGCFLLVQCSKTSTPEQSEQPAYTFILDEIPPHIQEIDNLTVFPGDSEPSHSIELIREQAYGETGEPYITRILGCVEDDQGRVIIWVTGSSYVQALYVYNADGTYYTQLGRQGKGPGEYVQMVGIYAKKIYLLWITPVSA